MDEPGASLHFRMQFSGKITLNDKEQKVAVFPAFTLRNINNRYELSMVASISAEEWTKEISAFGFSTNLKKGMIACSASFYQRKELYRLNINIPLKSYWNWCLGLEFKFAEVSIVQVANGADTPIGSGRLAQPATIRLRNLFHNNLNDPSGIHRGKKKRTMIKYLYSNTP